MPRVQANGIEIFYEEQGAGQPLLLIAGFACDHANWAKMIPLLASRYRVIVFDNRGVGQTSAPDSLYSIRQMAEDAAGVSDAMGLSRVHVAGHSMGGQIAQELALAHPERVGTLTLLSSVRESTKGGKRLSSRGANCPAWWTR